MTTCRFEQLTPHVDRYTPDERTDRPALAAIRGTEATLIVDADASPDHLVSFVAELNARERPPIRAIALTHWHQRLHAPEPLLTTAGVLGLVGRIRRFDASVAIEGTPTRWTIARLIARDWTSSSARPSSCNASEELRWRSRVTTRSSQRSSRSSSRARESVREP